MLKKNKDNNMIIKEITDINDINDFDNIPSDEKEFHITNDLDYSLWVRLNTWYNWDNDYDEVLYFFSRSKINQHLEAVSFGTTVNGYYLIKYKRFNYDHKGTLFFMDDEDDWSDPLEIIKGDLEISDSDSLGDVVKHIFKDKIIMDKDVFSVIK